MHMYIYIHASVLVMKTLSGHDRFEQPEAAVINEFTPCLKLAA